jgi:hypothetical protein
VALVDAGLGPLFGGHDDANAELLKLISIRGQRLLPDLDPHLMDRRLGVVVDLVALLRHDRDRADLLQQRGGQVVDLRGRGVPASVDAEVDTHLESRRLVLVHGESEYWVRAHGRVCYPKLVVPNVRAVPSGTREPRRRCRPGPRRR